MNQIDTIISNNTHCIFVSPHLDDAMFSVGGLIWKLSGKVPITIINVFTSVGDGRDSLSAKAYLAQCKFVNSKVLISKRIEEDKVAFSDLKVNIINLEQTDALWRSSGKTWLPKTLINIIPELNRVYPTYRFHISRGVVAKSDHLLMDLISNKIVTSFTDENYIVFCPMGTGKHVDHIVVRESCLASIPRNKLILWSDFPYSLRSVTDKHFVNKYKLNQLTVKIDALRKIELCKLYKTQFSNVISDESLIEDNEALYYFDLSQKIPLRKITILNHVKALLSSPKDYLFVLLENDRTILQNKPFVLSVYQTALQITQEIEEAIPEVKCDLIGSTGLKIFGGGDIDILVPASIKKLDNYKNKIFSSYGKPTKVKSELIQWKINRNNIEVELDLIVNTSKRYKNQINLFNKLKNDKLFNNKYQILKQELNYSPNINYHVARISFFEEYK